VKKFKKAMALSLALAMGLSLVACGGSATEETEAPTEAATEAPADDTADDTEAATEDTADDASSDDATASAGMEAPSTDGWDESKKIYAYSWDDDFEKKLNVVLDAHPEYKDYVEYINLGVASEESLEAIDNALASGDKYPSLIPGDVGSAKYWVEDDDKTANLYDLGFTEDMIAGNYDYMKDYATYNGELKAVTWQSTAGSVFYNRAIAKEVFGTDDPDEIQAQIGDWDKFFAAADKLKEAGYKIVNGVDEVYYAIINAHTEPWVTDVDGTDTLKLDDSVKTYLETAKKLYDGEYTNNGSMWDSDWAAKMADGGDVFCYFACPWMIGVFQGNGATDGSWGACVGPQSYYWGGTYVSIGKDTPNPELAAYICYELACDPQIGVDITNKTGDAVSNKEANERLANGEIADDNNGVKFLGGQNPYVTWAQAAEGIDQSASTSFDKNYESYIKDASAKYNTGEFKSVDEAIKYINDQSNTELGIPAAE
jgi:ABC-type glycerol-3-phosphate transport system substrate-binding protein